MNLLINAVSPKGVFILFNSDRKIISRQDINVAGNESSKLIGLLDSFLSLNNLNYEDIKNIVTVSGPGSFTGIRTISLLVNTIAYTTKNKITDISFFDLFTKYPICKSSSKRDTFIKKDNSGEVEIIKNTDLLEYINENNLNKVYGELSTDFFTDFKILDFIDYESIIRGIELKNKDFIEPIYIKKPSIS